ncbi:sodium:proton antiporter [Clostridium tetani]|uniref:Transport protein (Putative Na+/H+ antiporter) n=1 Tax=Clostridium tetani (strain Massachusetts / E88) TaxID=212717 RepID=Q891Q7_CLOTE|nr:Na+/H+ antiporter family protein [Clostridium tetani]AAO36788.1 transport protein (putative Na+/H+ antiporter) [Clostridium tetani E88]KGI39203.1 sodium:proton antiporter [Clostridium tetani ATCC 9441]KGI41175.1 sodium:proton antiporter [Clostridium tetani]KGI45923.1 sodium:proton antiporter [Clostridium tetani]KHO31136.1 sodium:proton antiporter [Clostridium tetani]
MILLNPVVISVIVMSALCLMKLNVLLSILLAAITAGVAAGMPITETMKTLIDGMGGNSETALSYVLLGTFAIAISKTGLATLLAKKISKAVKGNKIAFTLIIAFVACFSQNLVPIHIAFIPILIPPLISLMNKMKLDRRGVACALTFGLKAPYVTLPVGFGLIFHNIIRDQMIQNGIEVTTDMIWRSMWIAGLSMLVGLLLAVLIAYRRPREYEDIKVEGFDLDEEVEMTSKQWLALLGAAVAFVVQLKTKSLPLGALSGLIALIVTGSVKWNEIDEMIEGGLKMMALVAIVMLVAAGYGNVLRETGAVEALVTSATAVISTKATGAVVMLLVGLLVTMGIGTSFGTIPILAAIYCPLGLQLGFSIPAIILLIGIAAALGDAGSPASDSTLGPTSGLNIDGQHDHIWDTCVPTFIFYDIPLMVFGVIGSLML